MDSKVKEKIKKGYKHCGKAKVCPAFLKPKYSNDFAGGLDEPSSRECVPRVLFGGSWDLVTTHVHNLAYNSPLAVPSNGTI